MGKCGKCKKSTKHHERYEKLCKKNVVGVYDGYFENPTLLIPDGLPMAGNPIPIVNPRTLLTLHKDGTAILASSKQDNRDELSLFKPYVDPVATSQGLWDCHNGKLHVKVWYLGQDNRGDDLIVDPSNNPIGEANAPKNQIRKVEAIIDLNDCGEIVNIGNGKSAGTACQGIFEYDEVNSDPGLVDAGNSLLNAINPIGSGNTDDIKVFFNRKFDATLRGCNNYD